MMSRELLPKRGLLAWRPGHLAAAEHVNVKMKH